jgi:hypothetical protein
MTMMTALKFIRDHLVPATIARRAWLVEFSPRGVSFCEGPADGQRYGAPARARLAAVARVPADGAAAAPPERRPTHSAAPRPAPTVTRADVDDHIAEALDDDSGWCWCARRRRGHGRGGAKATAWIRERSGRRSA